MQHPRVGADAACGMGLIGRTASGTVRFLSEERRLRLPTQRGTHPLALSRSHGSIACRVDPAGGRRLVSGARVPRCRSNGNWPLCIHPRLAQPKSRQNLDFQRPVERDVLLSLECQHTVAEPVKTKNPPKGQRIFRTRIRSLSRRTAEFCDFAAVEAVKVRKLGFGGVKELAEIYSG
jgi:hypothetical protein